MTTNNESIIFSRIFKEKSVFKAVIYLKKAHTLTVFYLSQRLADRALWWADEDKGVEKSLGDCATGGLSSKGCEVGLTSLF